MFYIFIIIYNNYIFINFSFLSTIEVQVNNSFPMLSMIGAAIILIQL